MRAVPWRQLLLLAGLVATGLLLGAIPRHDFAAVLPAHVQTPLGLAGFVLAGAGFAAIGLPRQAVAYAGGFVLGPWLGGALALTAQMLGCAADLLWARAVARQWAQRKIGGRLARLDRFLSAHPFTATVMLRLLPVGNNLVLNLLAGVSSVPAGRFLAGSCIGYLPQTLIFALLGAGSQVDSRAQLLLGLALFAASAALGAMLLRRFRAVSASDADAPYGASLPR